MKYYIIAGEASGDLHGSNLMQSIENLDQETEFRFWGGDKMSEIAGKPVKHISELAFMGFIEVLLNLPTILKNIKLCKKDIRAFNPDVLILIDYPGFNLRIAEYAKSLGISVHYYISPQIWAWKQNRVHKIKRVVDEMYSILPFEKAFYAKFGMSIHYVGHPLVDAVQKFKVLALSKTDFLTKYKLSDQPIIALLPGSRNQEIKKKLPIMLEAAKAFPQYQIVIAGAPNKSVDFYKEIVQDLDVVIIENETYDLLNHSSLAMVTSGTATLETALFKVPQVVCYKASFVSYSIAKRLVKIDYISLVNLIMGKEVVKELIQSDLTAKNIIQELNIFIKDDQQIKSDYNELDHQLGGGGASEKVAGLIYNAIKR